MYKLASALVVFLAIATGSAQAQSLSISYRGNLLTIRCENAALGQVFEQIQSATGMELFLEDPVKSRRITADIDSQPLNLAVERLLAGVGVNYAMMYDPEDWQQVAKLFIGEGGGPLASSQPAAAGSARRPVRAEPIEDNYDPTEEFEDGYAEEEVLEEDFTEDEPNQRKRSTKVPPPRSRPTGIIYHLRLPSHEAVPRPVSSPHPLERTSNPRTKRLLLLEPVRRPGHPPTILLPISSAVPSRFPRMLMTRTRSRQTKKHPKISSSPPPRNPVFPRSASLLT
jgi:hypothetical protein